MREIDGINLCYQSGKYTFVYPLKDKDILSFKTRRLLHGAHMATMRDTVLIFATDSIALFNGDLYRMYRVPGENFRIHLNVPIAPDVMDWVTPTTAELTFIIYME